MQTISKVHAREILDSRGNPTVEVELTLEGGFFGKAMVPSGASTGTYEAVELRDGDKARYGGKGVLKAVANVNKLISQEICNKEYNQELLDEKLIFLDGTPNKGKLGANAILGVSLAFAKACAVARGETLDTYFRELAKNNNEEVLLPVPMMNVINGGAHAAGSTDIQEFMIVPHGAPTFREALRWGAEVFHTLGDILIKGGFQKTVGDEGGYAPALGGNMSAVKLIVEAIERAGYKPGEQISIALDVAASELKFEEGYELRVDKKKMNTHEMVEWYEKMVADYPIISIEDPLDEDDWDGYKRFMMLLGEKIQVVGDDLYVTNPERLAKGIEEKSTNAILIKLNQIGTLTETLKVIDMAKAKGWGTVISHRSGETEDTTIASLAVGAALGQIKTGSLSRTERIAKYNELLRIEEAAGSRAVYAGSRLFMNRKS